MGSVSRERYSHIAMLLHWLIAAALIVLLVAGLWMTGAIKDPAQKAFAFKVYQWHKSLGLTVLVLSIVRVGWRIAHPPPPLPGGMSAIETAAARATHVLLYGLMIGLPLAGWLMVSASAFGLPTMVFGLFEWPHLPVGETPGSKVAIEAAAKTAHKYMGYALLGLIALHVGAALKHQFIRRDNLMARMVPVWPRKAAGAASSTSTG